jgi:hypothetical protein
VEDRGLWQLLRETWVKIEPHYLPAVETLVNESGLGKREWGILLAALTLDPEDTTPSHLMVRGPYTASERYLLWLANAARRGYLEEVGESLFRLTPFGRDAVVEFIRLARKAMEEADPLGIDQADTLSGYLERLVSMCLNTQAPPDTWSIDLSYKLMPEREPALPYIEQAFSCLGAFRDDAHLAAWQDSNLSATAFEALTLIWRDRIKTLDDLTEKLKKRGHAQNVYSDSLAELRERGYLTGVHSALKITSLGNEFREEVESTTDRYFFAPWSCLDRVEKTEMAVILTRLKDGLNR